MTDEHDRSGEDRDSERTPPAERSRPRRDREDGRSDQLEDSPGATIDDAVVAEPNEPG